MSGTTRLDLSGYKCPLPALKTRKALRALAPGDLLEVRCTDPMAAIDIPHLIGETGDSIEDTTQDGELLIFLIKRLGVKPHT